MKLSLLPIFAGTSLLALACANDPSKEVRSAQNEVNTAQQNAVVEPAKVDAKHTDEQVEQTSKQQQERAGVVSNANSKVLNAEKKLAEAQVALQTERQTFDAKANERFEKMEAVAAEAKAKSLRLNGKKRTEFDNALPNYIRLRDEAARRVRDLRDVTDENWTNERDNVNKAIERAEKAVDDLRSIK